MSTVLERVQPKEREPCHVLTGRVDSEYAAFFVSDAVAGPGGPLATYGLVPDPELANTQSEVEAEETMASGS